ncbi:MAG: hypothetical protein RJB38_50 [Pseudomonadota bacterium]|jgi:hypothetical protein
MGGVLVAAACASAPKPKQSAEVLPLVPAGVYLQEPARAYRVVGTVRAWEEFTTALDDSFDEREFQRRCRKAFHDASVKLLRTAQENGGNAVVKIRSVVFLADGRKELYAQPECADDGDSGEALVEGLAVVFSAPDSARSSK